MERRQYYDVEVKLVGNQSPCPFGHNVGDEWLLKSRTPAGMCSLAYNAIFPMALALQCGGTFPWQKDPDDAIQVYCPDGDINNIFELRRIPRK